MTTIRYDDDKEKSDFKIGDKFYYHNEKKYTYEVGLVSSRYLISINGVEYDKESCTKIEYDSELTPDVKSYNIGTSNYSDMTIQPYDIFEAHPQLNYWECDIIKRILRSKSTDSRLMDYEKIEHIIKYLIKREKGNK